MNISFINLAKIKKADIETANLTIFIGKNGTNKSYAAHILYMANKIINNLLSNGRIWRNEYFQNLIKTIDQSIPSDLEIKNFIEDKKVEIETIEIDSDFKEEQRVVRYKFTKEIIKLLETIEKGLTVFLTEEINKSFNVGKIILEYIDFNDYDIDDFYKQIREFQIYSEDEENDEEILVLELLEYFVKFVKDKVVLAEESFYFPASRTGFVLAFDEIVSGVLRDRFGGRPTATKLTEPTVDFISKFADIKSGRYDFFMRRAGFWLQKQRISSSNLDMRIVYDFLKRKIIHGDIVEQKEREGYTQFYLKPGNSSEKLELHVSSSSVIEILPFFVFLKHFNSLENKLLVIEEPEAHLHPQAQIEIARFIVMLVNLGAKVIITTHSDYIINEINNLIKLDSLPENTQKEILQELDISEYSVLNKDKVKVYLFKEEDSESICVDELNVDKYGIPNDNFDLVLDQLIENSEKIEKYL